MKLVPFLLIVVLLLSVFLFPIATPVLGIGLIAISLCIVLFSIFREHRTAYLQGKLTRAGFVRNTFVDVIGILLAVTLALLLSLMLMGMVAQPIGNATLRLLVCVLIGLLVGSGVGLLVSRVWGRLIKTSPGR